MKNKASSWTWVFWIFSLAAFFSRMLYPSLLRRTYSHYKKLDGGIRIEVNSKLNAAVFFIIGFCLSVVLLLRCNDVTNIDYDFINTTIGQLVIALFGSISITEIIFDNAIFHWYTWLYHFASLYIGLSVYDRKEFIWSLSRNIVLMYYILLSLTFPIYIASLYYYLGHPKYYRLRMILYCISLITHLIFMFGQLIFGIFVTVTTNTSLYQFILFACIECCIMPSQISVGLDLYSTIKNKVLTGYQYSINDEQSFDESQTRDNVELEVELELELENEIVIETDVSAFMFGEHGWSSIIMPIIILIISLLVYKIAGYYIFTLTVPFLVLVFIERIRIIEPKWPDYNNFTTSSLYDNNAIQWWLACLLLGLLGRLCIPYGISLLYIRWTHDYSVFSITDYVPLPIVIFIHIWLINFIFYVRHWLEHKITFLWIIEHQIHHTPQRYNMYLNLWFGPLEAIHSTMEGLFIRFLFNISLDTILITSVIITFMDAITHANIKTPWILGFIIMRPESHVIHHLEPWPRPDGWTRKNFSNFPIVDIMFRTFENPKVDPRENPNSIIGFPKYQNQWMKQLFFFIDIRHLRNSETVEP